MAKGNLLAMGELLAVALAEFFHPEILVVETHLEIKHHV